MKIWVALALALLGDLVGVLVSAWPGGSPPPATPHLCTPAPTAIVATAAAPPASPRGTLIGPAAATARLPAAPAARPAPRQRQARSPATGRR